MDQDSDGNTVLACPHVDPGYLYPEEVSALIVQQLLEDAALHTNIPQITKAVITVPAYFDDEQRDATIAAGALTRHTCAQALSPQQGWTYPIASTGLANVPARVYDCVIAWSRSWLNACAHAQQGAAQHRTCGK